MGGLNFYDLLGWIVGIIGIALFFVGLFAKRFVVRSVPKCAGCRYELPNDAYTSGQPCPECGRVTETPRELYTLGRSRKLILIGMLLATGSILIPRVPRIQDQGWASLLPMSIQVRLWTDGGQQLRERVRSARYQGKLSDNQREILRKGIVEFLSRPNLTTGDYYIIQHYFGSVRNDPTLLREEDIVEICENSTPAMTRAVFQQIEHDYTPQREPLLELRRKLAQSPNMSLARLSWGWITSRPNGDGDFELIRSQMLQPEDVHVETYGPVHRDSITEAYLDLLEELSEHQDVHIQNRVFQMMYTFGIYNHDPLPSPLSERFYRIALKLMDSPHEQLLRQLPLVFDNLPESLADEYGSIMRTPFNDDISIRVIRQTGRMRELQPKLLPALIYIAQDQSRSIPVRMEAHRMSLRSARDGTSPPAPPDLPIYIDALEYYDTRTDVGSAQFIQQFQTVNKSSMLAALCYHMSVEGVTDGTHAAEWIEGRTGIRLFIRKAADDELPSTAKLLDANEQLLLLLKITAQKSWLSEEQRSLVQQGIEVLDSETPLPTHTSP